MLKFRILTALFLIPIFVALVIKLTPIEFCFVTGAIVLVGAWEWSSFMGIKKTLPSLIYPLFIFFIMFGVLQLPIINLLYVSVVWWIFALILVVSYPKFNSTWGKSIIVRSIMGVFVLIPCWLAINFIRDSGHGISTLLFLFVLIWGADTGAYFAGRAYGKHKLAPEVSPGKTWEGLAGALLLTLIISVSALVLIKAPFSIWIPAIILSFVTVLFSVLGDLFESMLKRNAGLKDSGRILPGHGGVLDRIDSLTAAAPVFTVGAILLGKMFNATEFDKALEFFANRERRFGFTSEQLREPNDA